MNDAMHVQLILQDADADADADADVVDDTRNYHKVEKENTILYPQ